LAAWFQSQGIGAGDAVALAMPTCPEFVTSFHGITRSGAAVAPMNAQYAAHEFADQISKTHSKYVVAHAALAAQVQAAVLKVGMSPKNVIVVGAPEGVAESLGCTAYSTLLACEEPLAAEDIDPATHVAALPMSSGIGGFQKPVMLSHRNLVADLVQLMPIMGQMGQVKRQIIVCFLPLSHVYALTGTMNFALRARHLLVTMPAFDPVKFLENIQNYRATMISVVPPVASLLAKDPMVDGFDLSSVEFVISGAAPLTEEVGDLMAKRLGATVIQGYGMTELSPVTHVMQPTMPDVSCESIGVAIPNVEFRVVDPKTGTDVAIPATGPSSPGELWVKGPNVMLGYLERPEETAEIIDTDQFLHTGDLVTVDARGVVTIVGRTKELIKNKGFQVAPAELEALLKEHPAVADVGVFGVSLGDGTGDEAPYAVIVLAPGRKVTPIDLLKHVSSQVAKYKFLRSVTFVEAIPRNADGTIQRAALPGLVPALNG